jgi:hypothetical protein
MGGSTVMSRLEVIQQNASGGICNITQTPTFTDIVSQQVHHFGRTFRAKGVPVLSSCGSRVFTVRIYVQLTAGANIKIDGSVNYWAPPDQHQPCVFNLPCGDTRTFAIAVSGP